MQGGFTEFGGLQDSLLVFRFTPKGVSQVLGNETRRKVGS